MDHCLWRNEWDFYFCTGGTWNIPSHCEMLNFPALGLYVRFYRVSQSTADKTYNSWVIANFQREDSLLKDAVLPRRDFKVKTDQRMLDNLQLKSMHTTSTARIKKLTWETNTATFWPCHEGLLTSCILWLKGLNTPGTWQINNPKMQNNLWVYSIKTIHSFRDTNLWHKQNLQHLILLKKWSSQWGCETVEKKRQDGGI